MRTIAITNPRRPDAEIVAVGIDVLRASSTVLTAVATEHPCYVATTPEHGCDFAAEVGGAILAGEQQGELPAGFAMQNSPSEVLALPADERPVVLVSTSGTPIFVSLAERYRTVVVSLQNIAAAVEVLAAAGRNVLAAVGARRGAVRIEDRLAVARLAAGLAHHGYAVEAYPGWVMSDRDRPVASIARGRSARYLKRTGQQSDLVFVMGHVDDLAVVPFVEPIRPGVARIRFDDPFSLEG